MKKLFGLLTVILITTISCNNTEKKAQTHFEKALQLYEQENYFAAKNEIDSIRAHYTTEVKVLRKSLTLLRKIELKESERTLIYCDSLLPIKKSLAESQKKDFAFELNKEYEKIGKYIYKRQTIEKNLRRCYIRCGVTEDGTMYLASVYYGKRPINHTHIKVSVGDDTYAQTDIIPYDGGLNYHFEDLGFTTEVITYLGTKGADVINFLYNNIDKRIKIEFLGGRRYIIYLAKADKEALKATYELATTLTDIHRMEEEVKKRNKRILYLNKKINDTKE